MTAIVGPERACPKDAPTSSSPAPASSGRASASQRSAEVPIRSKAQVWVSVTSRAPEQARAWLAHALQCPAATPGDCPHLRRIVSEHAARRAGRERGGGLPTAAPSCEREL